MGACTPAADEAGTPLVPDVGGEVALAVPPVEPADTATQGPSTSGPSTGDPVPVDGPEQSERTESRPLPAPLQAQIDGLVATVASIRELEFTEPPRVVALTPEEVVARRAADLADQYAGRDFGPEEALYRMLGVFERPVDLAEFYTEFLSASTLAYYDLEAHELVVPITGETLSPYEQWIMVHELTHALIDQRYPEVTARFVALGEQNRLDTAGGVLGLLEGDAVLVQSLFYDTLSTDDRSLLQRQAGERRNQTFAAAPRFFRSISRYPYTDGSLFALYLYRRGGTEALDRAYRQPPSTTEQVIAPELYIDGAERIEVDLRVVAPAGFEVARRGVWGARGWRSLLGQFLNGGTAAEAAAGWGGDHYLILWNSETRQLAFVAMVVGDSTRDASELAGALEDLVLAAMDVELRYEGRHRIRLVGADSALVERRGDRVLFIAATDAATGAVARQAVRGFD